MKDETGAHWRKQLVWGIIITVAGAAILLDGSGELRIGQIWRYWPVLLVIAGLSNFVPPTSTKLVLDGFSSIFFAVWFYASFEHLWGLSFRTSWPLLIITWGVTLVLKPLLEKQLDSNKGNDNGQQAR